MTSFQDDTSQGRPPSRHVTMLPHQGSVSPPPTSSCLAFSLFSYWLCFWSYVEHVPTHDSYQVFNLRPNGGGVKRPPLHFSCYR